MGGAAVMLTLAMGMRQSMGLFQPHMVRDLGITAAQFLFAIAIQNIVWRVTQPFVGMLVDRYGARPITSAILLTVGLGVCIGLALSCTGSNVALSVTSRTVSAAKRSIAMGAVSAVGSLGLMLASPLAQGLISTSGWQVALIAFLGLTAVMLPAAFSAGGADQLVDDFEAAG